MSEPHEAVIRRLFDAVNRRDLDAVMADFEPEVEWLPAREDPDAALHRGHSGVKRFLGGWFESFDELEVELEELVDGASATLALNHYVGRGDAQRRARRRPGVSGLLVSRRQDRRRARVLRPRRGVLGVSRQ